MAIAFSLLLAGTAQAEILEGRMNGLRCASNNTVCPAQFDPHVVIELDYVVSLRSGQFYYITNMDRETKMHHVLSRIRIEGAISAGKTSIRADKLWVKEDGEYELVWTAAQSRGASQTHLELPHRHEPVTE